MVRLIIGLVCVLLGFSSASAKGDVSTAGKIVPLWTGRPPGDGAPAGPERIGVEGSAKGAYSNIKHARMEIFRPTKPNGMAALIIGGGGYFRIQIGTAAMPLARLLLAKGITPVILYYRLPGDGWNADAPFQDGQRAMRLLRANAVRYGIDPQRIGVVGFSAGGHLAGILATRSQHDFYERRDDVDGQDAIPAFAGMIYPVVSLRRPIDTTRTRRELTPLPDAVNAYSVEAQVSSVTPPVFLAHAADDPIADVTHSMRMFTAMRELKRDAELHIFEKGGHSWGIGNPGSLVAAWPGLFFSWLTEHGWIPSTKSDRPKLSEPTAP